MDILVSYSVFIYRFYWVTCMAPVIIGNWHPSKGVLLIIDWLNMCLESVYLFFLAFTSLVSYFCLALSVGGLNWQFSVSFQAHFKSSSSCHFWHYGMCVQLITCWVFWLQLKHLMTVQWIAIEPLQQRSCLALLLLRIWQVFMAFCCTYLHLTWLIIWIEQDFRKRTVNNSTFNIVEFSL